MATIDILGINSLAIKGLGDQFNTFDRLFQSKEDANQAVETGDYVPKPGKLNTVLIAGEEQAIQFWSFDLGLFCSISEFKNAGNQANKYIRLDGNDSYIEFDNAGPVLDFTQDWTIGFTLVGIQGPPSSNKITLLSRGGVHITLQALEIAEDPDQEVFFNWGLYVTSDNDLTDPGKRAQANTWYAPGNFSRLLFTYDATAKKLKYYIGNTSNGNHENRATLNISQTMIDGQDITGGLKIGAAFTGEGGAYFSGINWNGGVNNLIGAGIHFGPFYVQEYYQNQSVDPENPDAFFASASFYDDLAFYCKLGEDTYPDVTDEKETLTGGELINGSANDFKDIPQQ